MKDEKTRNQLRWFSQGDKGTRRLKAEGRVIIRRANSDDNILLAEMGARTFSDAFGADNTPEDMAAYLAAAFSPAKQAAELADPSSVFLIAQVGPAPVGYARLKAGDAPAEVTAPRPIELARLYAEKEWIGHGVGAALMQACMDKARGQGYATLWLGVWERNPRAIAFYRRWGFCQVGTHVFQLGADPQTDLVMQATVAGVNG